MPARRVAFVVGLFLAATAPAPARSEGDAPPALLRLEFRAVTTNEALDANVQRKTPLVPRTEGTFRAVLGPRRVEIVEGSQRTVLDYEHERVLAVEADGSFREGSLLARVAFLEMELRNRARMAELLATAKFDDPSMRPREISIAFGWRAKGDDTSVTTASDGGATVFRDGEEELARWTPSTETLDEAQRTSFARFLHTRCRLHPAVRDAVAADGHVPAKLRFRWHDVGARSTTELTLVGAKRTGDAETPAPGRRAFDESDPVARVARRALDPAKDDPAVRLSKDEFVRLAREARKKERYEDAALLLIECGLQTGDPVTDELRDLRSDGAAGERLERLFGTIGGRDAARAVEDLAALDRSLFSRPHVLDVFRANSLASARRLEDARTAMLGALAESPWLAGAWKDLGDMYYAQFDTEHTWLAWEAGRRATPTHPMWAPVRQFEEHLRKAYREIL